ncbi:hypothetical protein GCG54_00006920 [Colletotrichum gloeosporioides]|uniref:Lysine-specific metallo-endopeptidase domain-containing protein n=1 Tax=Colletotrichum gloeosporioides TaxID=474922 RepID=A0A8H4CQP3_COLGL|nr:uncharacterized protein GCG54_00006920 [Colletotrichum gloeosporioides]KAF3808299.1 hypothetical protein GCG54_00006920 [Colletotrichum gloeosporioides]
MATNSFLLGLLAGILLLLSSIDVARADLEITDVFTVQRGGDSTGGCDARLDPLLDNWLTESLFSLTAAIDAVDAYDRRFEVRYAMLAFFSFEIQDTLGTKQENPTRYRTWEKIRKNMVEVKNFLEHDKVVPGGDVFKFPKEKFWLHCHSTFLTEQSSTSPALDYEGNEMKKDDKPITIQELAAYQKAISKEPNAKPWWSGVNTDQNGYYFSEDGRNYCQGDNLGATASIKPLKAEGGQAVTKPEIASVILCPYAFDNTKNPDNYRDANAKLKKDVRLDAVLPKSTTLVHEAFHAVHGDKFLAGKEEKYGITECLTMSAEKQQTNPESYVFFIAYMNHRYGKVDEGEENEPWAINKLWEMGVGSKNDRFGAAREVTFINDDD